MSEAAEPTDPQTSESQGRVTVVIAEDEVVIRMDLEEQLRELGYDVIGQVGNGEAAVELARELNPDIVILDVNMPVMDGISAARLITEEAISAVVMLTAYGQRDLVDQAVEAGAMAYLIKPWTTSELDPALRLALARFVEMQRLSNRVDQLAESLRTRKRLEQAKSVIQAAYGYSEPEAFRWLQKTAMDQRTSMLAIAERVLDTESSIDRDG